MPSPSNAVSFRPLLTEAGIPLLPAALPPLAGGLAEAQLFVTGSPGYLCALNNWLLSARKHTDVPITVGLYNHKGELSQQQQQAFSSQIVHSSKTRVVWRDQGDHGQTFWGWRLALLVELLSPSSPLHTSRYVVQADSDAVLVADPLPALLAAHRAGHSLISSIAGNPSMGHGYPEKLGYPEEVSRAWGNKFGFPSTMCMGFASFAADAPTAAFMASVCQEGEDQRWCDDQQAINVMLLAKGAKWSQAGQPLHGALGMANAHGQNDTIVFEREGEVKLGGGVWRIAALSQQFVMRTPRNQLKNGLIPGVAVVHPQTGKGADGVESKLRSLNIWEAGGCKEGHVAAELMGLREKP